MSAVLAIITKAARVGLVLALVTGPVTTTALAVLLLGRDQPGPALAAAPAGSQADRGRAAAAGVRAVRTWLSAKRGDEAAVGEQLPVSGVVLPEQPTGIVDIQVVDAVETAGVWAVSVVVDTAAGTRRLFRVPVRLDGSTTVTVLAVPAELAVPRLAAQTGSGAYQEQVPVTSPAGAAAATFVQALLAGQGDVQRLVAPGVQVVAVTPPPCGQVVVSSVDAVSPVPEAPADGTEVRVLLSGVCGAAGTEPGSRVGLPVGYPLTMRARADRWEVAAIDPAPAQ